MMDDLKDRWPRYFSQFVLFSAIYLIGGLVLISAIGMAKFFEYRLDLIARAESASFVFIGSMAFVSYLATAASIGYIAFGRSITNVRWGWSLVILAALLFSFTGFILLLFYFVCLRAPNNAEAPALSDR